MKKKQMTDDDAIEKLTSAMGDKELMSTSQINTDNPQIVDELEDEESDDEMEEDDKIKPTLMNGKGLHIMITMGKK